MVPLAARGTLVGGGASAGRGAEQAAHEREAEGGRPAASHRPSGRAHPVCRDDPAYARREPTQGWTSSRRTFSITLRSREGQAYVARSGDRIGVFGGPDATPVVCAGGSPTVTNTDFVLVRAGNRVKEPELAVDMRRGLLGPGFTDERDGTSEIEVFADVGPRGTVVVATTSGPDQVTVGPAGDGDVVNVNAAEALDDADVFASRGSVHLYGGAGPDQIAATAAPPPPGGDSHGGILIGGGGADLLVGSGETDLLQGDGGADVLFAGGSPDLVLSRDRARDQIDCGAGNDTYVIVDPRDDLAGCEEHDFEDPLADSRPLPERASARQALLATPALATASGLTQNDPSAKPWLSIPNAQLKRAR